MSIDLPAHTIVAPSDGEPDCDVSDLVGSFDLFDREHCVRADDLLRFAREKCPVMHTSASGGYHLVTRYDDVRRVLQDPHVFSSKEINVGGNGGIITPPIDADPPIHHDFRLILNPFFHPRRLAGFEDHVRQLADSTMAPWIDSGQCEFVADFAAPYITDSLASVIFEEEDRAVFRQAAEYNERVALGEAAAYLPYRELMIQFVNRRRERSSDVGDLVSAIINGTVLGRPLAEEEILGAVQIVFAGGLDTTKVAISNIMHQLATRPELEAVLRKPGWERAVLDEFLRYESPVTSLGRVATRDAEVGGVQFKAGDRVVVHYASANRDPRAFDAPEQLDFDRATTAPHLAFGLGIHRCIGLHFARLQLRVAIEQLLSRATRFRLLDDRELTRRAGMTRVLDELPIRFDLIGS